MAVMGRRGYTWIAIISGETLEERAVVKNRGWCRVRSNPDLGFGFGYRRYRSIEMDWASGRRRHALTISAPASDLRQRRQAALPIGQEMAEPADHDPEVLDPPERRPRASQLMRFLGDTHQPEIGRAHV